ncbi:MAG: hypothetical protein FWG36_00065 [Oscillospiraceae bacterium]|nr:hypothetical protein [Oscillospiraceae bacterium]
MKKPKRKAGKILRSSRGETLIESIASLVMLTVLLLTVSVMLASAMKMTSVSTQDSIKMQEEEVNPVLMSDYSNINARISVITFRSPNSGIHSSHQVTLIEEYNVLAFVPVN